MAKLLVVSRSMALAMRIADDHEVVEYPVEGLEELAPAADVDAVVLDLGEPGVAMQTLDRLRSGGHDTRVLIVSGYQPAWRDLVAVRIERVVVVPLPITRAALLDGIDRLLGRAPDPRSEGAAPAARPAAPAAAAPATPARPLAAPTFPADPFPQAADAPEVPAEGRRRQGLGRWLSGTPRGTDSAGDDRSGQDDGPAGPPTPPGGTGTSSDEEPDLFRPVVEPSVPVRSPSALPARTPGATNPGRPLPTRSPGPARPAAPARPAPSGPAARPVAPPPAASPAASPASSPASSPAASPTTPPGAPAAAPSARAVPTVPAVPPRPQATPSAPAAPAPLAPATRGPAPAAPAVVPEGPAPGQPPRGGKGRFGRGRDRDLDRHPGFTPAAGLQPVAGAGRAGADVHEWVRALLDRRSELFGVAETAQVLADEIIERGEADATAVLVPDGQRWRVSGGVGLRPLERRLLLDTSHWLIAEIAVGGRALIIEDTDIVRPRLAGAPLAAWRHLLAVPVPGIRAAVVLARGQEASRFTDRDLAAVVPVVAEAADLLSAALRMRELARVLAPLRDVDQPG